MEIRDILTKNYDLITGLENSIHKAKKQIQDNFWEKLEKEITKVCDLEVWDAVGEGRTFKVSRCKRFPSFDIALRVELDSEVWYGFVLLEDGLRVPICRERRFKEYVTLARNVLRASGPTQYTLGWKRLKYRNKAISFSDFGAEQMRYIVEGDELEKMVDKIANKEIKNAVDEFKRAQEDTDL